jgi:hypothetical protein
MEMKRLTMNLMLATAAWMVASSAAMAADLKFEIPFAFQVRGQVMSAGTYRLHASNGEVQFFLKNAGSGEAIFFNAPGGSAPEKEWRGRNGAVMQFACSEKGCALKQLWTNCGYPAYRFSTPKPAEGSVTRLALIQAAASK